MERPNKPQPNRSVTIYDIAKELGLASSTVARALNGATCISEKTRKRVLEAAAKMGYQPSLIARSLSSSRTKTIGVLVPMIGDTAYSAMVKGIENVAYNAGYNVTLCCSEFDPARQKHYLDMLQNRRVEGIIVIPSVWADDREIDRLAKIDDSGLPVIILEQNIPDNRLSRVVVDNYGGAKEIVNHLIRLGHQRIGCLRYDLGDCNYPGKERYAGYRAAMADAGLPCPDGLTSIADPALNDTGNQPVHFTHYYESAGRPTAVFAVDDMLAIKTIKACGQVGLRVPEDIAVVGFDDLLVSAYTVPGLTTVHQPATEIGRRAADLLFGRIDGKLTYQVQERIAGRLIVRESCGAALHARDFKHNAEPVGQST